MNQQRVVVVGGSLAGAHTAFQLRAMGHDGPLTVVGAEARFPYERPGLSKGYLTGEIDVDRLLVRPAEAYAEADIELRRSTTATGVDLGRRRVLLGADDLPYDALVIATGSANVRPPIPGIDLAGVHQLRTVEDADLLRDAAAGATRAVVVGMGFIGCEIAATLHGLGLVVVAVDALPGPMWAVLGEHLSDVVRGWHEERGVRVLGGIGVAAFEGGASVERVRLADGTTLEADLVVVGVGARPALAWLDDAPLLRAAGGLGVDAGGRTDQPGVFAVGDVAAVWDAAGGEHRRTEHYSSATAQAARVAAAVLDQPPPPAKVSTFWSEQYDHYLQYAGRHEASDDLVLRPEPFAAFFLRSGALTAVATVDNGRDLRRLLPLLGRVVDPAVLADPSTDLRTLV